MSFIGYVLGLGLDIILMLKIRSLIDDPFLKLQMYLEYYYARKTGQMALMVRRLPLVRKEWGSNLEPIKSPTRCQRLATAATLMCGPRRKAAEIGTAHS